MPGVQLNLGLALSKAADYANAIPPFIAELQKHPGDPRLLTLIGMSHYGIGDYLVAIPYLERAAEKDPADLPTRFNEAQSCLWSKQYQCVLSVEKEILGLSEHSSEAEMLAGEALDEQGDAAGAIAQFRAAITANPREPNAHFGLGYLLWKQSNFAGAAAEFNAEIANDPNQMQAQAYLGACYERLKQYDKAQKELLAAIAGDPAMNLAHRELGIVYAMTGRNDAAVKELQQALKIDPLDVSAHKQLARVYQAMGRKDEAKDEFSAAGIPSQQTEETLTDKINRPPTLAP